MENREIKFEVLHENKHFGYERINHYGEWEWCVTELNPDNMIRWTGGVMKNHTSLIRRQYTGLKDKNGKEIYEGDVLEFPFNMGIGFIVWYQTGWWIESPGSQARDREDVSTISQTVIIGNIYQNPELCPT